MRDLLGATIIILLTLVILRALILGIRVLERRSSAARSAETLLREFLTEDEYRQLCGTGYLEIASPTQPGRVYRVPRRPGRVLLLDDDHPSEQLCIQPVAADLPDADVVLMHKLLIQADEAWYLRTANHFRDPVWWLYGVNGASRVWPGDVPTLP
jgi:hypothetical protein